MKKDITLLDGSSHNKETLLDNMTGDEFYYSYMGLDKVLSYSSLKWLLQSPKWFEYKKRKPSPSTQALRDGNLIHTQILEPQKYDKFQFIDVSSKNTKKWKLAVEEHGEAYTYTMKEKYMNTRIATAFLQNDATSKFLGGSSEVEVPQILVHNGLPIRGKADIYRPNEFVADVKTTMDGVDWITLRTGEEKNQFAFTIEKYDYDLQAYLYTQMFNVPDFYWLVIQKSTTDIGVFKASEETLENGKKKFEACIALYEAFFVDELIDLSQYHKSGTI